MTKNCAKSDAWSAQLRIMFFISMLLAFSAADSQAIGELDDVAIFWSDCARRVIRVARRHVLFWESRVQGVSEAEKRAISWLQTRPRRDIEAIPAVKDFLAKHPVYISLTTSPTRISQVHKVIAGIDTTHVKEILLVLPEQFGRNPRPYEIPDNLLSISKVRVVRIDKDLGPATKLVPAAEFAASSDPEARIITIDDDIAYPRGMVDELIALSILNPRAVVGGTGNVFSKWKLRGLESEGKKTIRKDDAWITRVDILEGYGAIAYPAGLVPTERIKAYSRLSTDCLLSDDLVISMALRQDGIDRFEVRSPYFTRDELVPLEYGRQSDALHKGAGIDRHLIGERPENNQTKYVRALAVLISEGGIK